jgi:hypothetical protein
VAHVASRLRAPRGGVLLGPTRSASTAGYEARSPR